MDSAIEYAARHIGFWSHDIDEMNAKQKPPQGWQWRKAGGRVLCERSGHGSACFTKAAWVNAVKQHKPEAFEEAFAPKASRDEVIKFLVNEVKDWPSIHEGMTRQLPNPWFWGTTEDSDKLICLNPNYNDDQITINDWHNVIVMKTNLSSTYGKTLDPIMQYFEYEHLPEHLQPISKEISLVAYYMHDSVPECEERKVGLRKLLEAKDCFVRAAIEGSNDD